MAGIYQEKDSNYYFISYYLKSTLCRRSTGTKNHAAAEKIRSLVEIAIEKIEHNLPLSEDILDPLPHKIRLDLRRQSKGYLNAITLRDLLDSFKKSKYPMLAPRSQTTYKDRIIHLERFIADKYPQILAEDFDKQCLDNYIAYRLSQGIKPVSINNELTTLQAIYNWSTSRQLIKHNPVHGYKKIKQILHQPVCLEEEEVTRILNASNPKYRPIFTLMAYTGIRKGEAQRLEWTDIDFTRKTLAVRNKPGAPTKTGKERIIPLPDPVIDMLNTLDHITPHVFPRLQNQPFFRNGLRTTFIRAVQRAGIPLKRDNRSITLKSLRSTFASLLARKGTDITLLQEFLGHSDITMTRVYYVHLKPAEAHDVISKLKF